MRRYTLEVYPVRPGERFRYPLDEAYEIRCLPTAAAVAVLHDPAQRRPVLASGETPESAIVNALKSLSVDWILQCPCRSATT